MIFSNLRLTTDDFTAYPQVNVFTATCSSLSESKPEPQHTTRHIILSLVDDKQRNTGKKTQVTRMKETYCKKK